MVGVAACNTKVDAPAGGIDGVSGVDRAGAAISNGTKGVVVLDHGAKPHALIRVVAWEKRERSKTALRVQKALSWQMDGENRYVAQLPPLPAAWSLRSLTGRNGLGPSRGHLSQ